MKIEDIKKDFENNYTPKIRSFFKPLRPLGQAIMIFCNTTLGMVVLVLTILGLACHIIGGYYHHKYIQKNQGGYYMQENNRYTNHGYNNSPRSHGRYYNDDRIDNNSDAENIIDSTEQYINNQRQLMENRMTQMMNNRPTISDIQTAKDTIETNKQQAISHISIRNGEKQGYTIAVQNDTIKGSLIGTISDEIKEGLKKNNITLDNNDFSLPYTPEAFQTIVTLLDTK